MVYSLEHNIFIVKSYYRRGVFGDNGWTHSVETCKNDFRANFPDFEVQDRTLLQHIREVINRFCATGNVEKGKSTGRPAVSEEVVEDLRERMEENPRTSLRRLSLQSDVPLSTCQKVVKKTLRLYPYKVTTVHQLQPGDPIQRLEYCNWFQNNLMNNDLLDMTFYSDEAWFHLSGYVNSQNYRVWSAENPHVFVETPLHPVKVGVWIAVSRRRLIGPIFFHHTLNAQRYREEILVNFLNQLDDNERRNGYFQQDGATAHTAHGTIRFLQHHFGNRLISRGTNIPFPPRSPDLTPLDFSVFGDLKDNVFSRRLDNLDELMQRIQDCCNEIDQAQLQDIFENKKRRIVKCLEKNGGHFQMFM